MKLHPSVQEKIVLLKVKERENNGITASPKTRKGLLHLRKKVSYRSIYE
jgi:hypothetical protein